MSISLEIVCRHLRVTSECRFTISTRNQFLVRKCSLLQNPIKKLLKKYVKRNEVYWSKWLLCFSPSRPTYLSISKKKLCHAFLNGLIFFIRKDGQSVTFTQIRFSHSLHCRFFSCTLLKWTVCHNGIEFLELKENRKKENLICGF